MAKLVRWALVPMAVLSVWYTVLFLGMAGLSVVDAFCPPELVISGACTAAWHAPVVNALVLVCTAVAAVGIVIVPALVAPTHRLLVAGLAYGCGALFAVYAASGGTLWGPFFVAAIGGSGALWLASSWWRVDRR